PEQRVSTEEARAILPKDYEVDIKKFQKERIPLLMNAFKEGDLKKINEALEDYIHVPYRARLIDDYWLVEKECSKLGLPMTISGSGSTLIIFYKDNEQAESLITNVSLKKTKHPYRFVEASFNKCLALFKKKGE
ncbi:MAG: hypothetical protein IKX82_01590, partial [Bacilli bacterium]|nr:hypothetical protein [Bacilli bacterium]